MKISKFRKICIYLLAIFLIFSTIVVFDYSNNEKIQKEILKEAKNNNLKALDQEGDNYRLVTSADNVQVPVPKGYVASQVEGENYVNPEFQHTTKTYKVENMPTLLTWSSPTGEQYPWTQDNNGIWVSGNQGIPNSTSTLESEAFNYIKGTTLTINYSMSCQEGSDFLNIYLISITNNITQRIVESMAGNTEEDEFDYSSNYYTYTMNDWGTGRYKIRVTYSKDDSGNEGLDSAYIKAARYYKENENVLRTVSEDIKTKIHDGGFVIYQLTDEEIETDPNGTNVIINDTNKDTAQSTRNQYVWVPVANVEDLVRTKTINNGIMQFGQGYTFSNTSITKDTRTGSTYYNEPRLAERNDKTKYYIQKYSSIYKRKENLLNNMQEEFAEMLKSINKYKGFYIGRYETGDEKSHSSTSRYFFIKPKVVRYNSNIRNVNWYNSYKDLKRLSGKTGKYVETGIIYDTMWDYTLKWLNETDTRSYKEIYLDSGTWGNYRNTGLKYKRSANGTELTKNNNSLMGVPTGGITETRYKGEIYRDSPTSSNNIFDIAGNEREWSRYSNTKESRGLRGGNGGDSARTPVYIKDNDLPQNGTGGTRSVLLIK